MTMYAVVVFLALLGCTCAKVYDRCELAQELKTKYKLPEEQIATWVCIARHESEFNTSAVGHRNADGSGDHGLFQISDLYWCSPPGVGYSCGVSCHQLEDDDIGDDVACVKRIYRQHQRLAGDGFAAWAVYRHHCSAHQVSQYVEGCSDAASTTEESSVSNEVVKSEDGNKQYADTDTDKHKDVVVTTENLREGALSSVAGKPEKIHDVTTDSTKESLATNAEDMHVTFVHKTIDRNVGVTARIKSEQVIRSERKNEEQERTTSNYKPRRVKLYDFRSK